MTHSGDDYSWEADAVGSFSEAIREIGRRVKAGEEPMPTTGYFGRRPCGCEKCVSSDDPLTVIGAASLPSAKGEANARQMDAGGGDLGPGAGLERSGGAAGGSDG